MIERQVSRSHSRYDGSRAALHCNIQGLPVKFPPKPHIRNPNPRIFQVQRADAQLGLLKARSLSPSGRDRPLSPSTSSLLASPTPPMQTSPSPPPVQEPGSEEPAPEPMAGSEEPAPEPMVQNH